MIILQAQTFSKCILKTVHAHISPPSQLLAHAPAICPTQLIQQKHELTLTTNYVIHTNLCNYVPTRAGWVDDFHNLVTKHVKFKIA